MATSDSAGPRTEGPAADVGTRRLDAGALRPWTVLAIAVAAISPTTSMFLVYGDGLSLAGTGVVWAFVAGGVIALAMALCYAEVGSVFPSAGGTYTIVRRALGPVWGGTVNVLFLVLGITATSSILLAAATYLSSLVPGGLPVNWVALVLMAVVTLLSVSRIAPTGWVTAAMLVLELTVILAFTGFCLAHVSLARSPFTDPVLPGSVPGAFQAVGLGAILAATVPALFAFNGYDWPLYFAEETRTARRAVPRAVLLAAGIAVAVELTAVVAATYAIADLAATSASSAPLTIIATRAMGRTGADILLAGVVVAMFDTALAGNLGYARIFYAAARDNMWPGPLNRVFGHIGASRVPVYGFAVLFVGNGVLCVLSSLSELVTFTGVVIVIVYLLVAVAAIVSRVRDRDLTRTLRMPLWPAAPIVAIAGVVLALTQQTALDIVAALTITGVTLAVYVAYRRRLPGRLDRAPIDTSPRWEADTAPDRRSR